MARQIPLPRPVFLYTLDQIAMTLNLTEAALRKDYIYFDTVTAGRGPLDMITARNIADFNVRPDWRVTETELLRWLKKKGYRAVLGTLY